MKYIDISKPTAYYKISQKTDVLHSHILDQSDQYKINSYLREIMQKEAIKGYSPANFMNVLQGTECLAEGRQDLKASGGRHINRHMLLIR